MHLALARKYRPQNFLEIIGQDAIVKTLHNAIESNRIHHAYLFCGVRGIGKTSLARILAKSIDCAKGPTITPCQTCVNCQEITMGNSLDVIEIDGASNNLVDDVRELREQVKYLPTKCKYKIIIIDEVHMLSKSAFNALLKTLEEPPAHVIFIFATTEAHKIPITILSRCQKYDFRKLQTTVLVEHLQLISQKENINIETGALQLITQCAQGSVRDAVSLLDQACSVQQGLITEDHIRSLLGLGDRVLIQQTFAAIIHQDLQQGLQLVTEADQRGLDLKLFAESLLEQFRHMILMVSTGQAPVALSPAETEFFQDLRQKCDLSLLLAQYQILLASIHELALTDFQKTTLEITLVKISEAGKMIDLATLVDTIKNKRPPTTKAPQQTQSLNKELAPEKTDPATDWYELVKWITREKPSFGGLLHDAVPIIFSDQEIRIGVPKDSGSRGILIERVENIQSMIEGRMGRKIKFTITDLDAEKKKPSA